LSESEPRSIEPQPSRPEEDNALRHAAIVLIAIGMVASMAAVAWNLRTSFPERSQLVPVEGRLERIHSESFRSRTTETKWVVFDVTTEGSGEDASDHWLLPDSSIRFAAPLASLEQGVQVRGLVEAQERLVRGAEYPVKVVWEIEQAGRVVIPYALVLEVEQHVNHQSPGIGLMTAAIGVGLLVIRSVLSRLRDRRAGRDAG